MTIAYRHGWQNTSCQQAVWTQGGQIASIEHFR